MIATIDYKKEFLNLKEKKNCIILAHNYQMPEIQDVSDYVGDSYGLAVQATKTDTEIILFCGVDFMAETAYILNPDKKVLLPDLEARCPMAQMLPSETLIKYKNKYPEAGVVLYINTLAEAKAEADVVCTSSNAVKVCDDLEQTQILFGPDRNLASYVQRKLPEKKIIGIPEGGHCYVHSIFDPDDVRALKVIHKNAEVMVHPETDLKVQDLADFIGSTEQMYLRPKYSSAKEFIVGTEEGLVYRLTKTYPDREFYALNPYAVCHQMKKHTLLKAYETLRDEKNVVRVPEEIAKKAKLSIERMIEITSRQKTR